MAKKPRVIIPTNPGELFKLADLVLTQHQALKDKSPLRLLEDPSWDTRGQDVTEGLTLQSQIEQLERQLKELYGRREPLVRTVETLCRNSRDVLMGVYASNPARLGEFGFEVVEAPASAPKTSTTNAKTA